MKGYKVFNPDWTCRDFQYEVGKTYEMEAEISVCSSGFHFCKKLIDCFEYYKFNSKNKVAEIEAFGEIKEEKNKCCTNKIRIVKELTWNEVLNICNSGNCNSGYRNSGDRNSGDRNSGDWNSGDRNSGDRNSGDWNSGDWNSGNCNSGDRNSGDRNSGDWNSGDCNSGDWNSGDWNSGNWNSGDWNSGNCNSGYRNSGDRNSGDWNSGDWNSGDCNSGVFNTNTPKLRMFNKESDWTYKDWYGSNARIILTTMPFDMLLWIEAEEMTTEEKQIHPEFETIGGYLKYQKSEERQKWWEKLSKDEKEKIMSLPNFDKSIFKEITGIEV